MVGALTGKEKVPGSEVLEVLEFVSVILSSKPPRWPRGPRVVRTLSPQIVGHSQSTRDPKVLTTWASPGGQAPPTPNLQPPHSTPNQSRRITDGHKTPPHDPHQCPYRALSRMKRHSPGPEPVSCATQARTFAREVLLEQPKPNTPNPKLQQTKTQSLAAGPFSLVRTTSEPASCRALARVCNDTCLCDDQWSSALHGETDGGTSG